MSTPATVQDRPQGMVAPAQARKMFRMERYLPAPMLAPFLDHFWIVEWDLGAQPPYVQRTLPYPCVHLVFDRAQRHPGRAERVLALADVFPWDEAAARREVLECHEDAGMTAAATRLLAPHLPQELGYFDQAHVSADFRKLIGASPARYRKREREHARPAAA